FCASARRKRPQLTTRRKRQPVWDRVGAESVAIPPCFPDTITRSRIPWVDCQRETNPLPPTGVAQGNAGRKIAPCSFAVGTSMGKDSGHAGSRKQGHPG